MKNLWISALLLGAAMATGCGGKTPDNTQVSEQAVPTPASTTTGSAGPVDVSRADRTVLALPSAPLVHWKGDEVRTVGTPNLYAAHPVESLTRASDGSWTFHPATDKDHFATPYIPVRATPSERWVGIEVKGSPGSGDNCVLHVQDQKFENIGDVPCGGDQAKNGLSVTISLAAAATSIRMYVADPQLMPIVLPQDIKVTLYSKDAAAPATASRN